MADVSSRRECKLDLLVRPTYDRQLRLMMPTMRPVGWHSEGTARFGCSDWRTLRSTAASRSSVSSSDSSASSFFKVAIIRVSAIWPIRHRQTHSLGRRPRPLAPSIRIRGTLRPQPRHLEQPGSCFHGQLVEQACQRLEQVRCP